MMEIYCGDRILVKAWWKNHAPAHCVVIRVMKDYLDVKDIRETGAHERYIKRSDVIDGNQDIQIEAWKQIHIREKQERRELYEKLKLEFEK